MGITVIFSNIASVTNLHIAVTIRNSIKCNCEHVKTLHVKAVNETAMHEGIKCLSRVNVTIQFASIKTKVCSCEFNHWLHNHCSLVHQYASEQYCQT